MSTDPDIISQHYSSPCPFCAIANALPAPAAPADLASSLDFNAPIRLLQSSVPQTTNATAPPPHPRCFPVLAAPDVLAFLDIMPLTRGHLLVASRRHCERLSDLSVEEGREVGFWLPVLARIVVSVLGCADYNLVQNNGARAAQVVPHVHFHIIPRPADVREIQSQSWTMFGRGQRDELDDDEGETLAAELRHELRRELRRMGEGRSMM